MKQGRRIGSLVAVAAFLMSVMIPLAVTAAVPNPEITITYTTPGLTGETPYANVPSADSTTYYVGNSLKASAPDGKSVNAWFLTGPNASGTSTTGTISEEGVFTPDFPGEYTVSATLSDGSGSTISTKIEVLWSLYLPKERVPPVTDNPNYPHGIKWLSRYVKEPYTYAGSSVGIEGEKFSGTWVTSNVAFPGSDARSSGLSSDGKLWLNAQYNYNGKLLINAANATNENVIENWCTDGLEQCEQTVSDNTKPTLPTDISNAWKTEGPWYVGYIFKGPPKVYDGIEKMTQVDGWVVNIADSQVIKSIQIPNIPEPEIGKKPSPATVAASDFSVTTKAGGKPTNALEVTTPGIQWQAKPEDGSFKAMNSDEAFAAGGEYQAVITVEPGQGMVIANDFDQNNVTMADGAAKSSLPKDATVAVDEDTGVVTITLSYKIGKQEASESPSQSVTSKPSESASSSPSESSASSSPSSSSSQSSASTGPSASSSQGSSSASAAPLPSQGSEASVQPRPSQVPGSSAQPSPSTEPSGLPSASSSAAPGGSFGASSQPGANDSTSPGQNPDASASASDAGFPGSSSNPGMPSGGGSNVPPPIYSPPAASASSGPPQSFDDFGNGQFSVDGPYFEGIKIGDSSGYTSPAALTFSLSLPPGYSIEVTSADGGRVGSEEPIGTGCTIKLIGPGGVVFEEGVAVVPGDVLGTGRMTLSQLVRLAAAMRGTRPLEGAFQQAGDFTKTGKINLSDLVKEAQMLKQAAL